MCRTYFVIVVLTGSLFCESALGLSCKFHPLDKHYELAEAVVIAQVQSISANADYSSYELALRNSENLKGTMPSEFLLEARSSGWTSPTSKYTVGSTYLFFLRPGQVSVGDCDPSRLLEKISTYWLDAVRKGSVPHGSG